MNEPTLTLSRIYDNMRDQMELVMETDPNAAFMIQQLFATASAAVVERKERAIPVESRRLSGPVLVH